MSAQPPAWEIEAAERRRRGDELVLAQTGARVDDFSKRQLQELLRDAPQTVRPARLWRQDKSTLVATVQRYVTSEHYGPGLLAALRLHAVFIDVDK